MSGPRPSGHASSALELPCFWADCPICLHLMTVQCRDRMNAANVQVKVVCLPAQLSGCAVMLLGLKPLQAIHCSLKTCEVQLMLSCQACLQAISERKHDIQAGPVEAHAEKPRRRLQAFIEREHEFKLVVEKPLDLDGNLMGCASVGGSLCMASAQHGGAACMCNMQLKTAGTLNLPAEAHNCHLLALRACRSCSWLADPWAA